MKAKYIQVVQKNRLWFDKKYYGNNVKILLVYGIDVFLYDHDILLENLINKVGIIKNTDSWEINGLFHFPKISKNIMKYLEKYKINKI